MHMVYTCTYTKLQLFIILQISGGWRARGGNLEGESDGGGGGSRYMYPAWGGEGGGGGGGGGGTKSKL